MEYNNKAKLKEQNSSRLTDSKKGLVVTKGKGVGRVSGEGGRQKGIVGYHDWCTWCVWGHQVDNVAQRRQIGPLWHLTTLMDSDCDGVWGVLDNKGECSNHIVFLVKPS